jgi:hypothetical protein
MSVELRKVFTFRPLLLRVDPREAYVAPFVLVSVGWGLHTVTGLMGIKYCSEDYPARVQRPDRNPFHQSICTCCAMSRDSFVGS